MDNAFPRSTGAHPEGDDDKIAPRPTKTLKRSCATDAGLMVLLAASILVTMNVMGVTLIAAALVVAAVIARLGTPRFSTMLVIATVTGLVGMNLSYHLDIASGPTIVLTGTELFVLAHVAAGARGAARLRGCRSRAVTCPRGLPAVMVGQRVVSGRVMRTKTVGTKRGLGHSEDSANPLLA